MEEKKIAAQIVKFVSSPCSFLTYWDTVHILKSQDKYKNYEILE